MKVKQIGVYIPQVNATPDQINFNLREFDKADRTIVSRSYGYLICELIS